jgi:hypothetical protein
MDRAMKSGCVCFVFTIGLLTAIGPADAHHSMAAVFDFSQRISVTGTLTSVDWRNPHIYLYVEATNDEDETGSWAFEGPSPVVFRNMEAAGKEDFESAVGASVVVDASLARDGSMTGLIRTIEFPDGRRITLCPNNC